MELQPKNPFSSHILNCIKNGISDALSKKYLKEIMFCIHNHSNDELLEVYKFSFEYEIDGRIISSFSKTKKNENIKKKLQKKRNKKYGLEVKSEKLMKKNIQRLLRTLKTLCNTKINRDCEKIYTCIRLSFVQIQISFLKNFQKLQKKTKIKSIHK